MFSFPLRPLASDLGDVATTLALQFDRRAKRHFLSRLFSFVFLDLPRAPYLIAYLFALRYVTCLVFSLFDAFVMFHFIFSLAPCVQIVAHSMKYY
jgi:hypothetical protein